MLKEKKETTLGLFMNILFITSNRIGDAILSTGLLNYLIKKYKAPKITVAAGPLAIPLFKEMSCLDALIPFEKEAYGVHWLKLWSACVLKKWDLVVDVRGSLLSYFLFAKKRKIWRSQKDQTQHRVEALASLLELESPPCPSLWIKDVHRKKAKELLKGSRPLVAFGMGANWVGKMWRVQNFIELAQKLRNPDGPFPKCRFLLLGSPEERSLISPFLKAFKSDDVVDCVGKLDLLMVYACLKEVDFFIGNDSGLMHLSAAAGIPTLGLFGPSLVQHYRPWGERCAFVQGDHSYEELISKPNYDPKTTGTLMDSLSVDKVFQAVDFLRKD